MSDDVSKVYQRVSCYDHGGSYRHLTGVNPRKCQHCGSYNIEVEPGP